MKKLTLLLFITAFSVQGQTFDVSSLNTTLISPTIELDKGRSVIVANDKTYSAYFQYEINIGQDNMILGAGINNFIRENYYTGYIGKIVGDFRGVLEVGYIESIAGYRATFTSASFSYQTTENNFIGLSVNNIHNVAMDNGPDIDFDYYSKIIPKLFASFEVVPNIVVLGQLTSRQNDISVKYKNNIFEAGTYYSGHSQYGIFGTYTIGRFTFLGSLSNERINAGLKFM